MKDISTSFDLERVFQGEESRIALDMSADGIRIASEFHGKVFVLWSEFEQIEAEVATYTNIQA